MASMVQAVLCISELFVVLFFGEEVLLKQKVTCSVQS